MAKGCLSGAKPLFLLKFKTGCRVQKYKQSSGQTKSVTGNNAQIKHTRKEHKTHPRITAG
jgi:hypothetical protein